MNQIKCLQPPEHAGVLLSNPPQYRCYREGCHKTWVVGTEAPDCTMNQITNIEETHNTREFRKDLQNSFNCLFILWVNGMAFGLGILVVLKISEL